MRLLVNLFRKHPVLSASLGLNNYSFTFNFRSELQGFGATVCTIHSFLKLWEQIDSDQFNELLFPLS